MKTLHNLLNVYIVLFRWMGCNLGDKRRRSCSFLFFWQTIIHCYVSAIIIFSSGTILYDIYQKIEKSFISSQERDIVMMMVMSLSPHIVIPLCFLSVCKKHNYPKLLQNYQISDKYFKENHLKTSFRLFFMASCSVFHLLVVFYVYRLPLSQIILFPYFDFTLMFCCFSSAIMQYISTSLEELCFDNRNARKLEKVLNTFEELKRIAKELNMLNSVNILMVSLTGLLDFLWLLFIFYEPKHYEHSLMLYHTLSASVMLENIYQAAKCNGKAKMVFNSIAVHSIKRDQPLAVEDWNSHLNLLCWVTTKKIQEEDWFTFAFGFEIDICLFLMIAQKLTDFIMLFIWYQTNGILKNHEIEYL